MTALELSKTSCEYYLQSVPTNATNSDSQGYALSPMMPRTVYTP